MGAWGSGSFDNDSALDWLGDLADGDADLRQTLEAAAGADADAYLEVDEASAAVAAAEIVAAGHGKGEDRLHEDAHAWLAAHPGLPDDLVSLAHRAVERVIAASELQEVLGTRGALGTARR
jgi:hypothetical protein